MVSTAQALETEFINAALIKNSPTRRGVVLTEGGYEQSDYGERHQFAYSKVQEYYGQKRSSNL